MSNRVHIGSGKRRFSCFAKHVEAPDPLIGKTVVFRRDGVDLFGVVKSFVSSDRAEVSLALPNTNGVLEITDTAKTGFYVVAVNPLNGKVFVSASLTGSYGA